MKSTKNASPAQARKKTQPEEFDLVILGGGTGSTIAAWTFAGEGKQVAVVERKYIGGSCPNIACLPSKNIIYSAKVASYFRRSKEFGITHDGFAIDMADVRERKRRMVRGLNDMYTENYRNTGAEFVLGTGRFLARKYSFQAMRTALPKSARSAAGQPQHVLSSMPCAGLPAHC
jgi:pyruvate/2-oxoglutarate dehydrogenase complex dihydrolipoamide dehydrogenase (E3) component